MGGVCCFGRLERARPPADLGWIAHVHIPLCRPATGPSELAHAMSCCEPHASVSWKIRRCANEARQEVDDLNWNSLPDTFSSRITRMGEWCEFGLKSRFSICELCSDGRQLCLESQKEHSWNSLIRVIRDESDVAGKVSGSKGSDRVMVLCQTETQR